MNAPAGGPASGPAWDDARLAWTRWILGPTAGDRMFLYEELAALTGAGFGVHEAVRDVLGRASRRRKRLLERLLTAMDGGMTPPAAFASLPQCFSPVETHLVATALQTGRYDRAFRDAGAEVDRARDTLSRVLRAVAYPVFLLHFALFVPGYQVVKMTSGATTASWFMWTTFLSFWVAVFAVVTLHVANRDRVQWGHAVARAPLLGPVVRCAAVSRAARVACALHDAGADLAETFTAAADASGNGWLAADLRRAAGSVRDGSPAAAALGAVGAFGSDARSLLESGETSGRLSESFVMIAKIEEERFNGALRRLSVAVNVTLMVIVGGAVLWMFATVLGRLYNF